MFRRMGELLVDYGELSPDELEAILRQQERHYQPFGHIAAALFDIDEQAIWRAWADQYARCCPRVHIEREPRDDDVLGSVPADEAWSCHLLPLREHDGDLIMVTDEAHLAHALHHVDRSIERSVVLWLAHDPQRLVDAIQTVYPQLASS